MRLSQAAELAVRGVMVLADKYGNGPVTLDAVCACRKLPKDYLVKIFKSLAKADLITPIRGKKGGYILARDPKDISMLEVIEAVEGPIVLNLCQHVPSKCQEIGCPMRDVWADLQKVIRQRLAGMTLQNGRRTT